MGKTTDHSEDTEEEGTNRPVLFPCGPRVPWFSLLFGSSRSRERTFPELSNSVSPLAKPGAFSGVRSMPGHSALQLSILGSTFGADSAKYTASSSGKELSKVLVGATEK